MEVVQIQVSREELKQIIEEAVKKEIEKVIELVEDMFLTSEEKKLLDNIREKIRNEDYSELISIENVKI